MSSRARCGWPLREEMENEKSYWVAVEAQAAESLRYRLVVTDDGRRMGNWLTFIMGGFDVAPRIIHAGTPAEAARCFLGSRQDLLERMPVVARLNGRPETLVACPLMLVAPVWPGWVGYVAGIVLLLAGLTLVLAAG